MRPNTPNPASPLPNSQIAAGIGTAAILTEKLSRPTVLVSVPLPLTRLPNIKPKFSGAADDPKSGVLPSGRMPAFPAQGFVSKFEVVKPEALTVAHEFEENPLNGKE